MKKQTVNMTAPKKTLPKYKQTVSTEEEIQEQNLTNLAISFKKSSKPEISVTSEEKFHVALQRVAGDSRKLFKTQANGFFCEVKQSEIDYENVFGKSICKTMHVYATFTV